MLIPLRESRALLALYYQYPVLWRQICLTNHIPESSTVDYVLGNLTYQSFAHGILLNSEQTQYHCLGCFNRIPFVKPSKREQSIDIGKKIWSFFELTPENIDRFLTILIWIRSFSIVRMIELVPEFSLASEIPLHKLFREEDLQYVVEKLGLVPPKTPRHQRYSKLRILLYFLRLPLVFDQKEISIALKSKTEFPPYFEYLFGKRLLLEDGAGEG